MGAGTPPRWVCSPSPWWSGCPWSERRPCCSDDLYRYLWEGLALGAGHDVFTEAPATIAGLDDALRARVNHPEVPSVYPPLALLWFRFLALGGAAWFVQLATAVVDAAIPVGLLVATRRSWPALLYAVHPLPVLESAAGGHVDVPAVALAVASVAAWRSGRRDLGFAAAFAGGLTKLFPLAWLPVLVIRAEPRRALVWVVAAAAVGAALTVGLVGTEVPAGVRTYATTWAFDGLLYPWVAAWSPGLARSALAAVGWGSRRSWRRGSGTRGWRGTCSGSRSSQSHRRCTRGTRCGRSLRPWRAASGGWRLRPCR